MTYPAKLYAALHRGHDGDIEFYQRICDQAQSVLELGCGSARVLRQITAPHRVGLDCDRGLLDLADDHDVELVEGDMRDFDLELTFDRILLPHGSLYCLLNADDVVRCLTCARHHLAPGGRIVFDGYAADDFHRHNRPEDFDAQALTPIARIQVDRETYEVFEHSTWNRRAQRIDAQYLHVPQSGKPAIEATLSQRYLLSSQLRGLAKASGLVVEHVYGDFDGGPIGPDSEVLVGIARAPRRAKASAARR